MTTATDTCFFCNTPLVQGVASREHIIPNALGGWLKSRALLCKQHNSTMGAELDNALIAPLHELANMVGFERDRDETPPVVVTLPSGKYTREYDGNMWPVRQRPVVTEGDGKVSFAITSPDLRDARKHVQGLKRSHPKLASLDVDATMATAQQTVDLVREQMEFTLSGLGTAEMFRAVVKIAVGYYLHVGGKREHIRDCIDVVRTDALPPVERVGSFYAIDPLPVRTDAITNVLAIKSDAHGRLCAYIELLRAIRFSVRLSDAYVGPSICSAYVHDVLARAELPVDAAALRGHPWTPEDWDQPAIHRELQEVTRILEPREVKVRARR